MRPGLQRIVLLAIPVLALVGAFWMKEARGPYWLRTNFDPDYVYLTNALNLARGLPPAHVDHPGTTVQEIGAVVVRAVYAWNGSGDLSRDVLSRPETYLSVFHAVLAGTFALSLWVLGAVGLRVFADPARAVLLQMLPLAWPGLERLSTVQPENLLLTVHVLFAAALIRCVADERPSTRSVAVLGAIAGFGVLTKLTFIWVPLIPLLILTGWRRRVQYAAGAVGAVFLFGWPLLPRLPDVVYWIRSLATHTGHYGSGPRGFDLPRYLENLQQLFAGQIELVVVIAVGVVGLVLWSRVPDEAGRRRFRLLLGIVSVQMLQIAMVAKHPKSHYLLPAFGVASLSIFFSFEAISRTLGSRAKPVATATLVGFLILTGLVGAREARRVHAKLAPVSAFQQDLHAQLETQFSECAVVTYFKSSSPANALRFGNYYAEWEYNDVLMELFPRDFFFELETHRFLHFFEPTSFEALRATYPCVVFQGVPVPYFADALPPDVRTVNLTRSSYETLYRAIW